MTQMTVDQAMQYAIEHHRANRLPEAEAIYRNVLANQPENVDALYGLGIIALQVGHGDALAILERVITLRPDSANPYNEFGTALQLRGRLDESIASYRRAIALRPNFPEAYNNMGNVYQGRGQLNEASECYRSAIVLLADYAEARTNLANVLTLQGKYDEAISHCRRAVAVKPNYPEALTTMGNAMKLKGDYSGAVEAYERALAIRPNYPEAQNNLGAAYQAIDRIDDAVACYRKSIELRPDYAEAYHNLGAIVQTRGNLPEAMECYRKAIAVRPNSPDSFNNLGTALQSTGNIPDAIKCYMEAISLRPNYPEAFANLGDALNTAGRVDEAIAACKRAIELRPEQADAYSNLGNALSSRGRHEEAIEACEKALSIRPNFPEAFCNLGNALQSIGKIHESIECYRKALALRPEFAEVYSNLAVANQALNKFDDAMDACTKAIALREDYPEAHFNKSLILLLAGKYAEGWKEYEWRWRVPNFPSAKRQFTQPAWDGSDLTGKTILIHFEQGIGDVIQFARMLPILRDRGAKVLFDCPKSLYRLFKEASDVLGATILVRNEKTELPAVSFDTQLTLLSLPFVTGILEPYGDPSIFPYLTANPALRENWRQLLANEPGFKVGIAWAGSPTHKNDRNRSMPLATLAPLARDDVSFVSLQLGPGASQAANPPAGMKLLNWTDKITDFSDTAALVAELDLVICVDTAVAHLVAAMGKPVWMLVPFMPDFRWQLHREDTPWYPTMRLFRQRAIGDWAEVLQRVSRELDRVVAESARSQVGVEASV
jgi:tetratricopeptide (TPR) repeat protein